MILISNTIGFKILKEVKEDGRYILVKGKIDNQLVMLINIYAPPEEGKAFYKQLIDLILSESEGVMICGGDFNITLDRILDTTSTKKNCKIYIAKYLNKAYKELGTMDVWREFQPLERDYTHYSAVHAVYTRIDYILMNKMDRYKIQKCEIGVADVSDHHMVHLTIKLNNRPKATVWRYRYDK